MKNRACQSFVDLAMSRHSLLAFSVGPNVMPATASKKAPAKHGQAILEVTSLHRKISVHRCVCDRKSLWATRFRRRSAAHTAIRNRSIPTLTGVLPNAFRAHERGPSAAPAWADCRCRPVPVAARQRRLPPANFRHAFSVLVVRVCGRDTSQTGVGQQAGSGLESQLNGDPASGNPSGSEAMKCIQLSPSHSGSLGLRTATSEGSGNEYRYLTAGGSEEVRRLAPRGLHCLREM
jgi:hypothetical protein